MGGRTMREILFRGKRIDNGEWVEGFYAKAKDIISEKEMHIIFQLGLELFPHSEFSSYEEVDPATIGQYTDLKDKNGQRIFEGDIVHIWVDYDDDEPIKKYRAIVEFGNPNHEYNWGFQLKMIDTMSSNEDILLWVEMEDGGAFCEVIGSIHDNPEMMKEG